MLKTCRWMPAPLLLCGVLLLLVAARPAFADDAGDAVLKARLERLLSLGWERSFDGLREAEAIYEQAREAAPGDVRVPYAMAVVAIKHHRYAAALGYIETMRELRPNLWVSNRAKLWLLVVLRRYEASLEQLAWMSEQFTAGEGEPDAKTSERVKWMGRMFGFLEGPAGEEVTGRMLTRYESRIEEPMSRETRLVFRAGRDSLLISYSKLKREQDETLAEAKAKQEQQREQEKVELAAEGTAVVEQTEDLGDVAEEIQAGLKAELAKIDEWLDPLRSKHSELLRQAELVLARIRSLQIDLDTVSLQLAATPPEDVFEQDRLLLLAHRLEIELARQESIYRPLLAQGRRVEAEMSRLLGQRNAAIAEVQEQLREIGQEQASLAKRLRRVQRDQRKLIEKGEPAGRTVRVRAQEAVLEALNTYEPFSLEREKSTILRSFR